MAVNWAKTFEYVSGGYGYRPIPISIMDRPRDQTSDATVYVPRLFCDSPWILSGYVTTMTTSSQRPGKIIGQRGDKETHRHIGLATNVGLCQGLLELTGDTEITELNFTSAIHKNVCWLDI